jgi:hypothetical protein
MLFFPPLVFVNFIISRLKFGALVFYQVLGLVLLGAGVAIEYPQKVAEYSGLDIGIFHSEDLNQNRVVRTKSTIGKRPVLVEKANSPRSQTSKENATLVSVEKEKSSNDSELVILEPSTAVSDGPLDEVHPGDVDTSMEEMPDSIPVITLTEELAVGERSSVADPAVDEVSFWQDEEVDESMSMDDLLETPAPVASSDKEEGIDLKQSTQKLPKSQEASVASPISQVESSLIAVGPASNEEPSRNIYEAKVKEVPLHILEERERVRKKQQEMDLLAESLSAKIGTMVIVEKNDAKKEEGKLLSVNNKKLSLEKRFGAGTMENFIKLEDVKEVRGAP